MKKSLLALAVLGTMAGAASAQSSVTLFGVVDVNAKYVKNDGFDNRKSLGTDGINSSRLGFRGVEDLGGSVGRSGAPGPRAGGSGHPRERPARRALRGSHPGRKLDLGGE